MDHRPPNTDQTPLPAAALGKDLILVDGLCLFCNRLVDTIARRDTRGHFCFAHIQSALGQAILTRHGHDLSDVDTVFLLTQVGTERERLHLDGAAGRLIWPRLFPLAALLRFVPLPLLNLQYRLFARTRYRLFGASATCVVPTPELRARVLSLTANPE